MENEQLTPTADRTPEQIQNEMTQTRDALTEKVAALESQVVGTVQTAADTLTDTVESVKSFMSTAPGAVGDTMKHAAEVVGDKMKEVFDISSRVRSNPLASVGASAGLGFLVGLLISRGRQPLGYSDAVAPPRATGQPTPTARFAAEVRPEPAAPGLLDKVVETLGEKFRQVADTLIDTATDAVNRNVRDGVPKLVDAATELAADRLKPEASGGPVTGGRFGRSGSYQD